MKTTPQAQTGKKPNWRCGAPRGNRNAKKPVHPLSTLKARIRNFKRRVRAAVQAAQHVGGPHPSTGSG
jgi:hypothetical protein